MSELGCARARLSHFFPQCCRRDGEEAAMGLPAEGQGGPSLAGGSAGTELNFLLEEL